MRTTKEQLRRIVREAVQRKLRALDEAPDMMGDSPVDAVAGAMVTQLIDGIDSTFASNVHEMVVSVTDDNFMRPGRMEDIEHFATQAVEAVLSDPDLKDALLTAAIQVLHNAMEPE